MDENEPRPVLPFIPGQPLDDMSVDELSTTITRLEEEIARLKTARDAKSTHLSAAEALFAKPR